MLSALLIAAAALLVLWVVLVDNSLVRLRNLMRSAVRSRLHPWRRVPPRAAAGAAPVAVAAGEPGMHRYNRQMVPRRSLLRASLAGGITSVLAPRILRAQQPLELRFRTLADPDGWHPSLRLKGDWLIVEITDGRLSGFGEASHSRDDAACRSAAARIFAAEFAAVAATPSLLSLDWLATTEARLAGTHPDFIEATAISGINQALYDLLARREQVPVWQLFAATTTLQSLPLYTTINRALQERTAAEYRALVAAVAADGFATYKCAPFEAVTAPELGPSRSGPGLNMLRLLREAFPDLAVRVDFHERFRVADFLALLPQLEALGLDWIEEPFPMGDDFATLRAQTSLPVAAGELFWGSERFNTIAENGWADVIMPDVKHIGGFGPLLSALAANAGRIGVSPHNPSGPISTAASLHAAALFPDAVHSLEYAYDRDRTRAVTGEQVADGRLYLGSAPGWGVAPPAAG